MYVKQLTDEHDEEFIPVAGTASTYNKDGLSVDQLIENLQSQIDELKNSNNETV